MVEVMEHLGFARFAVVGHDRGGRVAYRLALDHPERVGRLAVLDIVPTGEAWDRADDVRGHAVPAGHFFPEEAPELVIEVLRDFLD